MSANKLSELKTFAPGYKVSTFGKTQNINASQPTLPLRGSVGDITGSRIPMTSVEFQKVFLDGKRHNKAYDSPRDISMLPPLKQSSTKFQRMHTEEGGISSKRDNVGPEQLEDIISQLDGGKDVKHSLQQYHQNSRARQQQALENDETSFKIQGSVFDALSNDLNDPQRSQNGIRSRLDGKKSSMGDVNGPRQAKKGSTMIITSSEQERARSPISVYQLPNTPKVDDAFTPTSGAQQEDVTSAKETTSAEKKKENYFQKKKQVQPLDPIKEMDIILRQMKSRDCQANIAKMQDELRSVLQQRSINTNARISHYKLASVQKHSYRGSRLHARSLPRTYSH